MIIIKIEILILYDDLYIIIYIQKMTSFSFSNLNKKSLDLSCEYIDDILDPIGCIIDSKILNIKQQDNVVKICNELIENYKKYEKYLKFHNTWNTKYISKFGSYIPKILIISIKGPAISLWDDYYIGTECVSLWKKAEIEFMYLNC